MLCFLVVTMVETTFFRGGTGAVAPEVSKPTPSGIPARTPEGRRIPRRVREGYDVVDPKTGRTTRAEILISKDPHAAKEYYKRTGITPPGDIAKKIETAVAKVEAKREKLISPVRPPILPGVKQYVLAGKRVTREVYEKAVREREVVGVPSVPRVLPKRKIEPRVITPPPIEELPPKEPIPLAELTTIAGQIELGKRAIERIKEERKRRKKEEEEEEERLKRFAEQFQITVPPPRKKLTTRVFVRIEKGKAIYKDVPIEEIEITPPGYEITYPKIEPSLISPTVITPEQLAFQRAKEVAPKLAVPTRRVAEEVIVPAAIGVAEIPIGLGVGLVTDPIGTIRNFLSVEAWMKSSEDIIEGVRKRNPRTYGNLVGMYLTGKGVSKLGGKLTGLKKGDIIVEVRADTFVFKRGDKIGFITKAQINVIKKNLFREIKKTGIVTVRGRTIKVDPKLVDWTKLTNQDVLNIMAMKGTKYYSKFEYQTTFAGKVTIGTGGDLATKLGKKIRGVTQVVEKGKVLPIEKYIAKVTKERKVPTKVILDEFGRRVIPEHLRYDVSALATDYIRKITGVKGRVAQFDMGRLLTEGKGLTKELGLITVAKGKVVPTISTKALEQIGKLVAEEVFPIKPPTVMKVPKVVPVPIIKVVPTPLTPLIEEIKVKEVEGVVPSAFPSPKQQLKSVTDVVGRFDIGLTQIQIQRQRARQEQQERAILGTLVTQVPKIKEAAVELLVPTTVIAQIPKTKQQQLFLQKQIINLDKAFGTPSFAPTPTITKARAFPFPFQFPKPIIAGAEKVEAYHPFGRSRGGIKKGRWLRLSKKPLTKSDALARGAYAIDNTVANTFKIKKLKKKFLPRRLGRIQNPFHFRMNLGKFRGYRIRKGKRVPMKDTWIERKGIARIDSAGEKRGLRLAKFIKQRGFLAKKQKQFNPNINNINKILGGI